MGVCRIPEEALRCILDDPTRKTALQYDFDPFRYRARTAGTYPRYEIFCRRLEAESFYSSAAVVASPNEEGMAWGAYSDMSENTSFERFVHSFLHFLVSVWVVLR